MHQTTFIKSFVKLCMICVVFSSSLPAFSQDTKAKNIQADFIREFNNLPSLPIPRIDSTSFDSFIDPDDYKNVNAEAFKLADVFLQWHFEGFQFRPIRAYRIHLSDLFYSVAVTVRKGDAEMVTQLINYDLNGKVIDSEMISYDEIAEAMTRYTSLIEPTKIVRTYYIWSNPEEFPVMEVTHIHIDKNGKFTEE